MDLVPRKRQGDEDEPFNPQTSPQPCCCDLDFPSLAFINMNRNDVFKKYLVISSAIFLSGYKCVCVSFRCSLLLLLTWHLQWVRMHWAVEELVQVLLRKRIGMEG